MVATVNFMLTDNGVLLRRSEYGNQQTNVGRRRARTRILNWKERKENRWKRVAMGYGKKGRPSQEALSICMLERQLGRSGSALPDRQDAFQPTRTKKRRSLPSLDRCAKAPHGTDKSSQDPGRFRSRAMTSTKEGETGASLETISTWDGEAWSLDFQATQRVWLSLLTAHVNPCWSMLPWPWMRGLKRA